MNKNPSIIQILMSIFSNQIEINESAKLTSSEEISKELKKAGLNKKQLDFAVEWFENFTTLYKEPCIEYSNSIRIFTNDEKSAIPDNCLTFLMHQYQSSTISALEFEFILHQAIMLNEHTITQEQFMWVYDMTIINQVQIIKNKSDAEDIEGKSLLINHAKDVH